MKYQYGDIIMFKPSGLFGKLICFIDGSPYSHAAIFLKYEEDIPLFIESHEDRGGVVITKLEEWKNYDVFRASAFLPTEARPIKETLNLLNTSYDYSRLWWIFKSEVLKFNLSNNDEKKLICSELCDYVYHYGIGGGYVCTPATIYKAYLSGKFKKI